MDQVLIQLVMDDQGEVQLKSTWPTWCGGCPPRRSPSWLAHFAAELDKDAQELQAEPHGRQAAPVGARQVPNALAVKLRTQIWTAL